jgi:DNA-binding transcriptional LysR family regulator
LVARLELSCLRHGAGAGDCAHGASQLRYFVTLAEELRFGRAAACQHIVQSALSQQLQRLERELGVLLLDCTTHHVELTPAGSAFPIEARQIVAHLDWAALAAQRAASSAPILRVVVVEASRDLDGY